MLLAYWERKYCQLQHDGPEQAPRSAMYACVPALPAGLLPLCLQLPAHLQFAVSESRLQ